MTHTHQFQEVPLTIYRNQDITHYRCVECKAIYAIRRGEEWQLNGEIVDDEPKQENN